jgi:hypothetical protein
MSDKYFASDKANQTILYLNERCQEWFKADYLNSYIDKIQRSWDAYHGHYYGRGHDIAQGGEEGELVSLPVNHYRSIATNMLNLITSTRPSLQARAVNGDRKSLVQAKLANGLLDYYMREKKLEKEIKKAVEYAIILGTGFLKLEWNSTKGQIYDYIEVDPESIDKVGEDGTLYDKEGKVLEPYPIYEGDLEYKVLSPYDVRFDPTKETASDHDWMVSRSFVNRFDLSKKYEEYETEILELPTKDEYGKEKATRLFSQSKTDDIPVYEFFHRPTEALPEGRYILYLNENIILADTILPYKEIPIYRIAYADYLGTPYGYTTMWDLLPLQYALNSLHSTILTNQSTFGVQNILNPRGNDVQISQTRDGLNFIEYNHLIGPPSPVNFTATPGEIFSYMANIEKTMETLSAMNSVIRGDPEKHLRSGTAIAMVHANAISFLSGLQQSYIQLLEDVGNGIINLLKTFAEVPRIAAIAGISNATLIKEFSAQDLDRINRIIVDVGNPLANTASGKLEMADHLIQMGLIKNPMQYLEIMKTGNLESITAPELKEIDTIRSENEKLLSGDEVFALATDDHVMHILEHKAVLADPELRSDSQLVQKTMSHILEHIELLKTTDPQLLSILGQPQAQPQASGEDIPPMMTSPEVGVDETLPTIPESPDGSPMDSQELINQFNTGAP